MSPKVKILSNLKAEIKYFFAPQAQIFLSQIPAKVDFPSGKSCQRKRFREHFPEKIQPWGLYTLKNFRACGARETTSLNATRTYLEAGQPLK